MFDFKDMKNSEVKDACSCTTTHGLFMHNKQVSILVASLLLLSFFLFMGGYFLGQKNAIAAFSNKIDQESFSDQIYSSMCTLSDNGQVEEDAQENEESATADNRSSVAAVEELVNQPVVEVAAVNEQSTLAQEAHEIVEASFTTNQKDQVGQQVTLKSNDDEDVASAQYYAQLAGFGTVRAAQQFAQKLGRKEISVVVKKRQSRSARGKFVFWYQVSTEKFEDKNELEKLVVRLQAEEKLKDVNIVTC